ncbi:hypothetical protein OPT61_g2183 [Boeremia exigua]|uniref:Uncharacterized protein n=1 Tax=Boeremia exigua TaxID=749465 RepID=A0ACC2IMG0_9PLEO|nr:hypothetical protein OPT61_g2183 [Boeremia exigua]
MKNIALAVIIAITISNPDLSRFACAADSPKEQAEIAASVGAGAQAHFLAERGALVGLVVELLGRAQGDLRVAAHGAAGVGVALAAAAGYQGGTGGGEEGEAGHGEERVEELHWWVEAGGSQGLRLRWSGWVEFRSEERVGGGK